MLHIENLHNTIIQCYLNQNHPTFNGKRIFRRFLEENEDKEEGMKVTDCEKVVDGWIQNSDRMIC